MTDSRQLLAEYAKNGSDTAFRELVNRYIDLVYSTALRLVEGDAHRAQDVSQTVFLDLARKARTLPDDIKLGGWVHRATCLVAGHTMRGERRRQSRERQAVEMNALQNSEADFSEVAPILDEAINELGEADRTAILLRFFEQQDFRTVGQALGSNEDAARMRVTRALEKLESLLKRRGVTASSVTLAVALSANAVQAAPVGLAVTISTAAALAGTTIATATATKAIVMTTMQKTIIGTTLAVAIGAGTYGIHEASQNSELRLQMQNLQEQQTASSGQIEQLQRERNDANNRLTALANQNATSPKSHNELLKLRGEVARLRADSSDPSAREAQALLSKVDELKQRLDQDAAKRIPELQFLTPTDWINAALNGNFTNDHYAVQTLSRVRSYAKDRFAPIIARALRSYTESNNGLLPTALSQLKPHFQPAVGDALLDRYELLHTGRVSELPPDEMLVREKAIVDERQDTLYGIALNCYSITAIINGVPGERTIARGLGSN